MVLKVGKCGVRSGNSIKVPNAKYLRHYRMESVLVRTHITNSETSDAGVESYLAEDTVHCNSVPYSLNKKNRWTLPEQIRQEILHGDHTGEKFGIQLVERHKLNKQADCIGVCSTKTKLKRKRKGYIDEKSIFNAKPAFSRKRRQERIKHGLPVVDDESQEKVVEPDQIRYDVLYPCPPTSALTYTNPKFQTPTGENGLRNKGGRQRLRYAVADTIEDSLDCIDSVFDDSEEEEEEEDSYHGDEEEMSHVERTTECLIEDILRHAEHASKLVKDAKRGKRHGSKSNDREEGASKSHIIFEERDETTDINEAVPAATYADWGTTIKKPDITPVLVILPTQQVDPQNLKFRFGNNFIECDCFPRKFVIDISQTLTDYLPKTNFTKTHRAHINACIVFIHDVDNEINNPKESVYRIFLNTNYNSNQQSVKIETIFDYVETNIDEIIQCTLFYVETLPYDVIEFDTEVEHAKISTATSAVEEIAKWKAVSYKPHEKYLLQNFVNNRNDDSTASELHYEVVSRFDSFYAAEENANVTSPKDRFCNVCFELLGSGKSGTALISCGHWFCDNCWTEHLWTKINRGSLTLQCPEFDCEKIVDPGTALTLVKMKDIVRYSRVCHDAKVEQTATTKWCPNERCGRVLKTCREDVRIAQCQCGTRVCFQCLGSAHWPAPCESASRYNDKLVASGYNRIKPFDGKSIISVDGKCCPTCERFVEKVGGGRYMKCVCRVPFCWGCGQKVAGNNHRSCYYNGNKDKYNTVKKYIRPEDPLRLQQEKGWYLEALIHRRNQHPDSIKRLNTASKGLSKQIQRHIMKAEQNGNIVTLNFDLISKSYTNESNKVPDFLRNTVDLYREINHILENATVLLNAKSLDKAKLNQITHVMHRLTVFADDIFDIFVYGVGHASGSLVEKLVNVRYYSRLAIHGLVKGIKMAQL